MPLEVILGLIDHNMEDSKGFLYPFHIKEDAQKNVNFDGKEAVISGDRFETFFNFSSYWMGSLSAKKFEMKSVMMNPYWKDNSHSRLSVPSSETAITFSSG